MFKNLSTLVKLFAVFAGINFSVFSYNTAHANLPNAWVKPSDQRISCNPSPVAKYTVCYANKASKTVSIYLLDEEVASSSNERVPVCTVSKFRFTNVKDFIDTANKPDMMIQALALASMNVLHGYSTDDLSMLDNRTTSNTNPATERLFARHIPKSRMKAHIQYLPMVSVNVCEDLADEINGKPHHID